MLKNFSVGRPSLERLDPIQRALICNGCGPRGLGWIVPDFKFGEAGDWHDLEYWIGGGRVDRLRADLGFFRRCLTSAFPSPWLALLACLYFLAVRLFGGACYHWGEPRTMEDLPCV